MDYYCRECQTTFFSAQDIEMHTKEECDKYKQEEAEFRERQKVLKEDSCGKVSE